jgi:hypothetical protein
LYILRINIAVATKRNITFKPIVTSSVGRQVAGRNSDCLSYDMKNVGEPNEPIKFHVTNEIKLLTIEKLRVLIFFS